MKKRILLLILAFFVVAMPQVFSQGVTTSSISGKVVDIKGEAVPMANVVAIHTPSGTQYGTSSMDDGGFQIRNMRIGGPYKVVVSFIGFVNAEETDIYLQLNKTSNVSIVMQPNATELAEVEILAKGEGAMSAEQTGAMTNIDSKQIQGLPSIARSSKDLTRLTPQSDGNSFGGRNNLYNNFSLDGSIFNNSFGLDYATPGGQADAQPVSLDAIDQIQVSLAPFDVREGGFTGAGVNAVTKSGTNDLKATVYTFLRNEKMIGDKISGVDVPNLDFSTSQTGVSVGGPIIKDKLFFFINAEAERRDQLAHGFVANDGTNTGANVTSVSEEDIIAVQQHLINEWGYDPGAYQGYNHQTYNNKFLIKLDYNIAKNHNLTLRYNMLDAWKDILPHPEAIIGRGPTSYRLPFENSSYTINNKIHSIVGELNSIFSSKLANKLLIGYTAFRDTRDPHSAPFPVIDIFDANGNLAITAGSEMFSTNNILDQDVFQFTDNLTYYKDKHTITAGVNLEIFKFNNSFNLFYYPWHMFGSVADFLATTSADIDFNQEVTDSQQKPYAMAEVDVAQLGLYLQDEFQVNDQLNLTYGLRIDVPIYLSTIEESAATLEAANFTGWVDENGNSVSIDPSVWPKARLMWSPRIGFNYDVKGDNSLRVRGGTGIFTGRIPFVWLGNQSSNRGMYPGYTFQINSTSEDFHFPQVWKTNLAADWKLANGWFASFEGIYGKDINAVVHRNYNMLAPSENLSGTGDNRAIFAGFNEVNIYSSSADAIGFLEAGTIVMDNVSEGYQYSLTGKLQKAFDFGLRADVAYTYQESKDFTSIPAEIAADAFQRNPVVGDPNDPQLSWSRYGLKHRFISSWMYQKDYKNMTSSFALIAEAGQGNRYSYTYAGDLNQDAILNNDLLYVPISATDIHFGTVVNGVGVTASDAAAQWTALNAFIDQDDYLSTRRGQYAERNGASLPWFSQLDFRFMQDFHFKVKGKKNTLQLSLDVMNIGNLINSNWGVRQYARTFNPVTFTGLDANNVPYFQFDTNLKESYIDNFSVDSKWQMQFGIRYIFN
ncbi:MAG TPA: TonB-dependent receptor [Bacteroidales bacterium]|nr:TonB-dependent receptor [Bacteroidales bacterium]